MSFTRAGQLARPTPSVRPDDPLGLVAENLRETSYGAIPVLDKIPFADGDTTEAGTQNADAVVALRTRVLGLIDERDLSRAVMPALEERELAWRESGSTNGAPVGASPGGASFQSPFSHGNGAPIPSATVKTAEVPVGAQMENVVALTAREAMRTDIGMIPAMFSLHNALLTLDRYDASALPVIDETGSFRGMISRADVVAALGGQIRPPLVGGMATPLGVWLTTGHLSAGVPPLGLFLSGATLAFCFVVAELIMKFSLAYFSADWAAMFESGRLGAEAGGSLLNLLITLVHALVFLCVLRLLPMAGIHAAEHQTVWAIERGLPLTPEVVATMPRAHPRCGTNLMVLSGLITVIFGHLPNFDPMLILISLVFIYFFWRSFGTLVQNSLTTRPATRGQLESGIRAGKQLLEKYQAQPHVMGSFGARLLNSGLLVSMAGFAGTVLLYKAIMELLAPGLAL